MNSALMVPILIIIYNRHKFAKYLGKVLKNLKPMRIYVYADGPTNGEDQIKCDQVRRIFLNEITWDCELKTNFRSDNLGIGYAVPHAIDWFFTKEEEGIILEDDCIPSEDFFHFTAELLSKYKEDPKVMQITGCNVLSNHNQQDSYFFSKYTEPWGWATWRNAWGQFEPDMNGLDDFLKSGRYKSLLSSRFLRFIWNKRLKSTKRDPKSNWDYKWLYSVWKNNGIVIRPNANMIKNVGFSRQASHTFNFYSRLGKLEYQKLKKPLIYPEKIQIDEQKDKQIQRIRHNPKVMNFIFATLKNPNWIIITLKKYL
jgi:hypothetical protein